jgi:hypothetical protein
MVGRGEGELRPRHLVALLLDLLQRGGAGEVVQQVAVDMQQREAAAEISHDVRIPDLVEQRLAGHGSVSSDGCARQFRTLHRRDKSFTGTACFQPAHDASLCAGAGWKPAVP